MPKHDTTYVCIGRDMDPDLSRANVLGNYTCVCQVHSQDLEGPTLQLSVCTHKPGDTHYGAPIM